MKLIILIFILFSCSDSVVSTPYVDHTQTGCMECRGFKCVPCWPSPLLEEGVILVNNKASLIK